MQRTRLSYQLEIQPHLPPCFFFLIIIHLISLYIFLNTSLTLPLYFLNYFPHCRLIPFLHFQMKMKSPKFNSEPPRTLKDFLSADSAIANKALPRSPSTRIPAFHALLTALKNFHFSATVKSSSKRTPTLCGGGHRETPQRPQIKLNSLTIKDIIRWKSFRDLPEQDTSPQTAITTTSSATSSPCGSSGSSWCGSDFTAEYLPWWRDGNSEENGEGEGKKCLPRVGEEKAEAVTKTKSEVGPEVRQYLSASYLY